MAAKSRARSVAGLKPCALAFPLRVWRTALAVRPVGMADVFSRAI